MQIIQTTPRCPHFGTCGGCETQHISYEQQVENKATRLKYLMQKYYQKEIEVHALKPYNYRNRMDFICTEKGFGLRKSDRGFTQINICSISDERITATLNDLQKWFVEYKIESFDRKKIKGVVKYATIRTADNVTVIFSINEDAQERQRHLEAIEAFAKKDPSRNVLVSFVPASIDDSLSTEFIVVQGSDYLSQSFLGIKLYYHANAFFQNNPDVAEKMVAYVRDCLVEEGIKERVIVDAYGGVATFGFALAPFCKKVVSIESHPLAAPCIEKTASENNITNVEAHTLDSAAISKMEIPSDAFYILDPPRSGMEQKALQAIMKQNPSVIAYISCNPAQLAKEMIFFSAKYEIERLALFDMFPQTNHSEAVAILKRII